MGRKKVIDDETLLAHARAEFLERGVFGSTKEIALKAGISEAAIFKRFPTKAKLYMAAMIPTDIEDGSLIASEIKDTKEALTETAGRLLGYFRQVVPTSMHLLTNPLVSKEEVMEHFGPRRTQKIAGDLAKFIEQRGDAGELKPGSSVVRAQLIIAAIHSLASYEMMGLHGGEKFDTAVPAFIDTFWDGLAP